MQLQLLLLVLVTSKYNNKKFNIYINFKSIGKELVLLYNGFS